MAKRDSTQANSPCHTRQLELGQMIYDYRRKDQSQAKVPWLKLKRHWLDRAGFAINIPVSVRVMEGAWY